MRSREPGRGLAERISASSVSEGNRSGVIVLLADLCEAGELIM